MLCDLCYRMTSPHSYQFYDIRQVLTKFFSFINIPLKFNIYYLKVIPSHQHIANGLLGKHVNRCTISAQQIPMALRTYEITIDIFLFHHILLI